MSHSFPDVLLQLWKVRHTLHLNIRKPQFLREYDLIHPRLIHRDIPTHSTQKFHRLILTPDDGIKE